MDGRTAAATLGVGPRATRAEIRQAFRARAKVLHPDAGPAGSSERFIALRLAVEQLMADAPEGTHGPDGSEMATTSPAASATSPAPAVGTAGRRWPAAPFGAASTWSDRAGTAIDLTDTVGRTPRQARPTAPYRGAVGPVPRDARGLSFEDHLAAALARP